MYLKYSNFILFVIYLNFGFVCSNSKINIQNQSLKISETVLTKISNLSNTEHFMKTLDSILIPRVPGSDNHKIVRDFIIKSMESLHWQVDRDTFEDITPHGKIRFENIIATQNPSAERFLILACHYDSKFFPDDEFVGATDSAVPCSMMINLAQIMNDYLKLQNKTKNGNKLGLMFIFFDGEEAFVEWGPKDSIYGARHLATKWESENFLKKIDMLMLLDLLGAPDAKFYSFFKSTENAYIKLIQIEEKLTYHGALDKHISSGVISKYKNSYFQEKSATSYIEDDHIPFLRREVPILHMIPIPFPDTWHTPEDNKKNIDFVTVENLNKILRAFVAEYLELPINDGE
ncbi:glutaminyl-peptide cyclotransferase-like isoform X2 [Condylostylus longicornis]|uniref:glutaminyl-peptide cyclotransferase-like isoform X2 n=1 Tax=Condylostylus longicornis TaxID=2530218 RepID=UPI00244E508C|nr:glutaminyl-peptide cyclotransferase-like isoform X2 [Condylostylus longicornis]